MPGSYRAQFLMSAVEMDMLVSISKSLAFSKSRVSTAEGQNCYALNRNKCMKMYKEAFLESKGQLFLKISLTALIL